MHKFEKTVVTNKQFALQCIHRAVCVLESDRDDLEDPDENIQKYETKLRGYFAIVKKHVELFKDNEFIKNMAIRNDRNKMYETIALFKNINRTTPITSRLGRELAFTSVIAFMETAYTFVIDETHKYTLEDAFNKTRVDRNTMLKINGYEQGYNAILKSIQELYVPDARMFDMLIH